MAEYEDFKRILDKYREEVSGVEGVNDFYIGLDENRERVLVLELKKREEEEKMFKIIWKVLAILEDEPMEDITMRIDCLRVERD